MALKLPRLQRLAAIAGKDGLPDRAFHQWWDTFAKSLETAINDLADSVAAIQAAQDAADAANAAAAAADAAALAAQGAADDAASTSALPERLSRQPMPGPMPALQSAAIRGFTGTGQALR